MDATRPTVVVSGCLEFEACRFNGQRIPFDLVGELGRHAELVPVCPEVEIGLGTPRDPVRLVRAGRHGEAPRLVQPATGRDVTDEMRHFADRFLAGREVDGFLLKNRSPSCGITGVKVYDGPEASSVREHGPGLFAAAVKERFETAAVEDEGRLRNFRIREHFFTRLWAGARLRAVERTGRTAALVEFHSRYKLVLMGYNQTAMRTLGRIVANQEGRDFAEMISVYRDGMARAFARAPRARSVINVLEHAWGYVSKRLSDPERTHYRALLDRYRHGRLPVSAPAAVIESAAVRFGVDYLLDQFFFRPFPEDLMSVADSGKGRGRRR